MMAKGLGRGLSALFSDTEEAYRNAEGGGSATEISLEDVFPNPNQPRKAFDENAMNELANSIKAHGVISPIVVNRSAGGKYMIIAGERRYRAAKLAGLDTIPAIVREFSDKEIQEISLIENLQREDLNPIEAAYGMKRLMEEFSMTQEVLAERLGKSRPAIANTLRLLTLPDEVIDLVRTGKLSSGHARALVPLQRNDQIALAQECVRAGWSVREMERAVKQRLNPPEVQAKTREQAKAEASAELKNLVERMRSRFRTKVSLIGSDKKGRIYIDYYTRDDLDRISDLLDVLDRLE